MSRMTWEEKLFALNALASCDLKMRKPGDWYVMQHVEVKDGSVLIGSFGNGVSPEDAVCAHWEELTDNLKPNQYLVYRYGEQRKAVKWNGFMWNAVTEAL